jgi:hypothetical protein
MVYLSIKALVNNENIIYNLLTSNESIMRLGNFFIHVHNQFIRRKDKAIVHEKYTRENNGNNGV